MLGWLFNRRDDKEANETKKVLDALDEIPGLLEQVRLVDESFKRVFSEARRNLGIEVADPSTQALPEPTLSDLLLKGVANDEAMRMGPEGTEPPNVRSTEEANSMDSLLMPERLREPNSSGRTQYPRDGVGNEKDEL